jgi:glycosyltransferase involved in cell wall biosynthesis
MEVPHHRFCDYCTDPERCRGCLEHDWGPEPGSQGEYRRAGEQALRSATRVVFPSTFLHQRYSQLFLGAELEASGVVVEPATRATALPATRSSPCPHLALVGGVKLHKGGGLLPAMVARLRASVPELRCTVFGDVDPELMRTLTRAGRVAVRGYYRAGQLSRLLRRAGTTVAVLPSIWPESYGLVVDECLRAGVPVVAFDLGAPGHRLRRLDAGRVVALEEGAEGLADAVLGELAEPHTVAAATIDALPTPETAALAMLRLYGVPVDHHGSSA